MAKNSIFKNILYQSILTFFNFLLPFFTGTYVVRVLSVESYGVFNTASAYLSIFITIGSLAIGSYGIRELSQTSNKTEFARIYSELFLMRFVCNTITFGICCFCLTMAVKQNFWIYFVLSIQIISNIFEADWVNIAKEEFKFITFKTIIIRMLYVILLVCFVRNKTDVLHYCMVISISEFLNNFISFIFVNKTVSLKFRDIKIKKHFKSIAIVTLSNNIGILYNNLDKIFLAWVCGEKSVSYYTITATIYYMVETLYSGLIGGVTPRLSYLRKNNTAEYQSLLKCTLDNYAFLLVPSCVGVMVLAPEVLMLYGSEKYLAATAAMIVAGIYRICMCYESVISKLVLYQYGKEKIMLIFLFVFGVGNLFMNLILTYWQMLNEVTTIIASIIINILMILCYIYYIKKHIDRSLILITFNQLKYFGLSLFFIPISMIVHIYFKNTIIVVGLNIILCSACYLGLLSILHDTCLMEYVVKCKLVLNKVKGRGK